MTAVRQNILLFDDGDELLDCVARHLASIGASRAQILAQGEASAVELEGEPGGPTTTLDGPLQVLCASGHTDRTSSNLVALIASNAHGPRSGRLRCAFMKTGSAVVFAELSQTDAPARAPAAAPAYAASAAPAYAASPAPSPTPAVVAPVAPPAVVEAPRHDEVRIGEPRPLEPSRPVDMMNRALPAKPFKRDVEEVIYPEEGDSATHFVFGRCTVVFSDGERIKLQQERDGRVREVSLSALKVVIQAPLEDGKRHFDLLRRA